MPITEVRWHGRGGQGAVTSTELIALAAIAKEKYAQSFPSFGPERRGAPVQAFLRVGDEPIRVRSEIAEPDAVVVLNPDLFESVDVTAGLSKNGILVINTKKSMDEVKTAYSKGFRVAIVDAMKIARESIGLPITNTTMIGALLKVVNLVEPDDMLDPLEHRFGKVAHKNVTAMRRAYEEIIVEGQ